MNEIFIFLRYSNFFYSKIIVIISIISSYEYINKSVVVDDIINTCKNMCFMLTR